MKILHLLPKLEEGGVTTVLVDLALGQQAAGHAVRIAAFKPSAWDDRAVHLGLKVGTGVREVLSTLAWADVIHSHQRATGLLSYAMGRGKCTIEHVHNKFLGQRLLSFRCARIFAVSNEIARLTAQNYPHVAPKIEVIHNAASEPRTYEGPLDQEYDILGVGRMHPQKNPLYFLDIAAELLTASPNLRFAWFGDGPLRMDLVARRKALGLEASVAIKGWAERDVLASYLRRAQVLVLSSDWEGLPIVALESLALGTPVASTPCGDLASALATQQGGAVFDFGDPRAAAQAIQSLMNEGQTIARSAARATYERNFSMERSLAEWQRVYSEVLATRRNSRGKGAGG